MPHTSIVVFLLMTLLGRAFAEGDVIFGLYTTGIAWTIYFIW